MDSLNKTRSLFYIKVHEAKKALIKDIGPVNRVHLTVLVSWIFTYEIVLSWPINIVTYQSLRTKPDSESSMSSLCEWIVSASVKFGTTYQLYMSSSTQTLLDDNGVVEKRAFTRDQETGQKES